MKISELARLVEGVVEGDGDLSIKGLNGVDKAGEGDVTFAMDAENLARAEKGKASCVLADKKLRKSSKTLIRVPNPKLSFLMVYNVFNSPREYKAFVDPSAVIAPSARIGKNVWIGSNVFIGEKAGIGDNVIIENNSVVKKNCRIGDFCHIHPNVTLYENTILKKNVILHSGVVAGADGFGYVKDKGKVYKFPQLGIVIIEDDVEIGANTTIDKGSLGDTVIGAGSKIDNMCQIAHNVKIGRNMLMAAQCGISGSTVIGDNVTMGGQAGIVDNVVIGDNVTIGAKSAVIGSLRDNAVVWGIPARPIAQTKRQMAVLSQLAKSGKISRKSEKQGEL